MIGLAGKRALFKSSTLGIGYAAALGLLEVDARVATHGRDITNRRHEVFGNRSLSF
jgi:hypothetical protein